MKRRDFSLALAGLGLSAVGGVRAQAAKPREGKDYAVLDKRVSTEAPQGAIEVIEFFSYNCPHCAEFEPLLATWAKQQPKDVTLRRVPVAFIGDFEVKQRMYYALEAMGKVDEYQIKVFNAIHRQRQNLAGEAATLDWVQKQGLDKDKFAELFRSFSVASKVRRATQLQDAFRVEGVPALGIAGRYYTDGTMAGGVTRALQVADHLIAQARKTA